jgi:hypothetical protein
MQSLRYSARSPIAAKLSASDSLRWARRYPTPRGQLSLQSMPQLRIDGTDVPYFQQLFWAGLATCSYLPSTVFPTGTGTQKLPIGLQAIGDTYADLQTIEFARLVTQELGGFPPPPGLD